MKVPINTEYITLGQFLKMTAMVASGGQVKEFIADTEIFVNNEPATQRGKKLFPGDTVTFSGESFTLVNS